MTILVLLLLSGSLAGSAAAAAAADPSKRHVQLVTPTPFAWVQYGPTNPLRPDGSDYPCKVPAGDAFALVDGTAPAEVVAGAAHAVRLAGWAVHGGGSCQFALAAGHAPARDARWRVIRSIEGGCPRANATGNLAPGEEPDAYTFVVPEDFAPGNYTWAWTWVNRIGGSPEFYMNCAPITVKAPTGSGSSRRRAATTEQRRQGGGGGGGRRRQRRQTREAAAADGGSTAYYPDLFLANIGSASNGCNTSEALYQQVAIAYPHPGNSVSRPNGPGESLYEQPCDGNPRNNNNNNNGATSTLSSSSLASSTAIPPAAATSTLSEPVSSSRIPTASSPSSSSSASSTPAGSVVPSSTVTFSSSSSAAAPTSTSTSTTTTLDSPCTDGHLLCVGGTQFSTCTGGAWDAPQDLAADTTCEEEGESVGLDTTYHWA